MRKKEEDIFKQFEQNLYEAVIRANPNNIDALQALGYLYTSRQEHQKALEVDKKLVSLKPHDAICHYNLACSYSNLGMIDQAFEALEFAILLGYHNLNHIQKDPDLNNLRKDPRYQKILQRLKKLKPLAD